jgi:AhpD family alkylhydroperoxidase
MPKDILNRILAEQKKSGFIPNVFLVLAHRPDEFRVFFAYHDALMEKPGNLTKAEREMIVVATSSSNQCQYCVVAHGAILRIRREQRGDRLHHGVGELIRLDAIPHAEQEAPARLRRCIVDLPLNGAGCRSRLRQLDLGEHG